MKRLFPRFSALLLAASAVPALPSVGRADSIPLESQMHVTYHGGPLLQHVKVALLFWGQGWQGSSTHDYLKGFFPALFEDGRYMANLSQYSQGNFQIGNGSVVAAVDDPAALPAVIDDVTIPEEIVREYRAGTLPAPDADTLYVVFTPPGVTPQSIAQESDGGFVLGYHSAAEDQDGNLFPYVIVPTPDQRAMAALLQAWGLHRPESVMTAAASHEVAEAVTDPLPAPDTLGWNDDDLGSQGEIGDIPMSLYDSGRIAITDLFDVLTAADGTRYLVQKEWSERDGKPVAFAAPAPGVGLQ